MRILLVVADFRDPTYAGRAFAAQHDALGLTALGHDVVVVTNTEHSTLRAGEVRRGAWRGVPVLHLRTGSTMAGESAVSNGFGRLLASVRPDLLWCETGSEFGMARAADALRRSDAPPVIVAMPDARWLCERTNLVRSNGRRCGQVQIDPAICATCVMPSASSEEWRSRSQLLRESAAAVVVPSAELREIAVASGIAADRVTVLASVRPTSPDALARPPWSGPLRLGFIDGHNDAVGFEQMIRTFQRISRSDYEFAVANGTSVFGVREFNVGDWGIPGYVHIAEPFTASSAAEFFSRIDLLIMPSAWQDHFGFTVRAAIEHGVWPVVADGVGVGEYLTDGVDGQLVPPDADPVVVAGVITSAIERRATAAVADFRTGNFDSGQVAGQAEPLGAVQPATRAIGVSGARVTELARYLQAAILTETPATGSRPR